MPAAPIVLVSAEHAVALSERVFGPDDLPEMTMKIIVAETAGFCMGVRRAVDMAVDNAARTPGETIHTLGPLIHNNQTLEMLRGRGVEMLDEAKPIPHRATVLIRAHGIPPEKQQSLKGDGNLILDGTCPKVKTVHKVIAKYRSRGYAIIIAGDEGHAEVIGLLGYAGESGYLVQTPEDIDSLQLFDKVCLVSQTTFDRETFDAIARRVHDRYPNASVVIRKTICSATDRRQSEIKKLAQRVDALFVVGGKNSANTQRLANIARQHAAHVQHVETEKEIDWRPLAGCKTIGVTAGASTPNWMIKRVVDQLHFLHRTHNRTARGLLWRLIDSAANLNLFVALGGVAMYYVSCFLQQYPVTAVGASLAFLYMFSMYLWNSLASIETTSHLGISRHRFYSKRSRLLFCVAVICIACMLLLSITGGVTLFALMALTTIAGSIYHLTLVPRPLRRFLKYGNLKDIPTSRDLFVALAWAVVLTFLPQAENQAFAPKNSAIFFFFWAFFLAFLRSLIFDLRDIEGDRIMGRETLVTIIGEKRARQAIMAMLSLSLLSVLGYVAFSLTAAGGIRNARAATFLLQTPAIVYIWLFMRAKKRIAATRGSLFALLADGQFYISGLMAWLAGHML